MRTVSNASPISALALIDRLYLLDSQFAATFMPTAVIDELEAHPDAKAIADIHAAIKEERIQVLRPRPSHLLSVLLPQLHRGEAEAIALAAELKADFVLIDEREGRRLAVQAGLSVTGVLGILLRAKLRGAR